MKRILRGYAVILAAAAGGLWVSQAAEAVPCPEVEANESKATATSCLGMVAGDTVTGTSTGSSTTVPGIGSADYFRVSTGALPLGIYRHRLVITTGGAVGHTGTIRGLNQINGTPNTPGTTDAAAQTSSATTTPPRFNQWYGFGKAEEIYYRVAGVAATTTPYDATLETAPVTVLDLGTYDEGPITIKTLGETSVDTDLWVYDGGLNALAGHGNDDESIAGGGGGTTLQSLLTRTYTPGTYYLALTNFNLAINLVSPEDDDFQTGTLLDFPDAVLNSSTSTALDLGVAFTDGDGTTTFSPTKATPYEIVWGQFTVVPEPTTLAVLGLAAMLVLRRRTAV